MHDCLAGGGVCGKALREIDWAATTLGPVETWPQSLRTSVRIVLSSEFPMMLHWGPDLVTFYNDAYAPSLGSKHPGNLGRPAKEWWSEMWEQLVPIFDKVLSGGTYYVEDARYTPDRHGGQQEAFFTHCHSPLWDDVGEIAGIFLVVTETTRRVIAERKLLDANVILERENASAQDSQARLAALVRASSEVLYSMNADWTEMRQLSGGGFLADTSTANANWLSDYIHPDDHAAVKSGIDEAIRNKSTFQLEHRVRLVDGSLGWTASRAVPLLDAEGSIVEWFGAASDVTARRRAEIALREANETLERRVEERTQERDRTWKLSRDMLGVADDRGVWLSINPAWTQILGWNADEIVGKTSEWMEHPEDVAKTRAEIASLAAGSTTFEFENRIRNRDGDYRILSWTAVPENDRLYCVARDVTEARAQADLIAEQTASRERTWKYNPDLLSVIDMTTGSFDRVNPAWVATLGWSIDEIEGKPYTDFVHPDDQGASGAAFDEVKAGSPVLRFENRYRTKDGNWRWLSWVAFPEGDKLYSSTRDVTAEKEKGTALRLFQDIVGSASAPICAFDKDFRLIAFNKAHSDEFFRIYHHRVQLGDVFPDLFLPEQAPIIRGFMARALTGENFTVVEEFGDPDIAKPSWEVSYSPIRDETGEIIGAFHYAQDISARVRARVELEGTQEALRQSQKMEAVGQLTGGLAHDFNNLLAGISGSLDMMQTRIQQGRIAEIDRYLVGAQGAARRAAALTHRLLAFSRRQTLEPKPTDVNRLVSGMEDLIRRTVGPHVAVEAAATGGLWSVLVDPNQLENALLNLCINARDAMPDGGRITIEMGNRRLDERAAKERDLPAGQYVSLCVSDNGTGMPKDVIDRAFDPFFTTKPIGVGTGLGLSMIYGFARQSGGQVRISSEVGQGTKVCIYLPRHHADEAAEAVVVPEVAVRDNQSRTVLVIDDEPLVRMLVVEAVEELGYTAIEAGDGPEGLKLLRLQGHIDLLITDVGLPNGMNGRQVADAAREMRAGLKVLFVTGYAENAVLSDGHLDPGMQVVTKPFDMNGLTRRIQGMMTE